MESIACWIRVGPGAAPQNSVSAGGKAAQMYVQLVVAVVIIAGGPFGYDQGAMSGAPPGIKAEFSIGVLMAPVVTSWVMLGALVGSLAGGVLSDEFGRKRTMLFAGARQAAPEVSLNDIKGPFLVRWEGRPCQYAGDDAMKPTRHFTISARVSGSTISPAAW